MLATLYRNMWGTVVGPLESFVDSITMYHTVQFALTGLVVWALGAAALGYAPFTVLELLAHGVVIIAASIAAHMALQYLTKAPANVVSTFITAYILILTLTPSLDLRELMVAALAGVIAVVGKYVLVYRNRHVFNPAALALFVVGVVGLTGSDWWVGASFMFPAVVGASFFLFLKTRKAEMQMLYIVLSSIIVCVLAWDSSWLGALSQHFFSWPTLFIAAVMLVEPLGMPGGRKQQYIFAAIVAAFGSVYFAIPPVYSTPELALLIGNLYTFLMFWPERHTLRLVRSVDAGGGVVEYVFAPWHSEHTPGQYAEWALPHAGADSRGERRLFSISSAAGASEVAFAVRHVEGGSSYKRALKVLTSETPVYLSQVAGDFTQTGGPMVLVAGGIGITPFLSWMRTAEARGVKLDATLFYCNNSFESIAYRAEVARLAQATGVTLVEVVKDAPAESGVESGYFRVELVRKYVQDTRVPHFFLSGPPSMVGAGEDVVREAGVPRSHVVTDYFPGLV